MSLYSINQIWIWISIAHLLALLDRQVSFKTCCNVVACLVDDVQIPNAFKESKKDFVLKLFFQLLQHNTNYQFLYCFSVLLWKGICSKLKSYEIFFYQLFPGGNLVHLYSDIKFQNGSWKGLKCFSYDQVSKWFSGKGLKVGGGTWRVKSSPVKFKDLAAATKVEWYNCNFLKFN